MQKLAIVCVLWLVVGCGDDSNDANGSGMTTVIGAAGQGSDSSTGGGVGARVQTSERLSYIKQVSSATDGQRSDLYIYDFERGDEINLTDGLDAIDCESRSCKLSDGQEWIGWLAKQSDGVFRLQVAPVILGEGRVDMDGMLDLASSVSRFDFSFDARTEPPTPIVIFTRSQADTAGRKEIVVRPLTACTDCEEILGSVDANGGYRVTDYDGLFVFIETTLSSMSVRLFNLTTGSQQDITSFGVDNSTGSEFSGGDPIGLSPNAEYLSVFTKEGFLWRLNVVEARPDAPEPNVHELFETATSRSGTCMRMGDYFFQNVVHDPAFSADSEWIYFLVSGTCTMTVGDPPSNRTDYDVLRINRNLSGVVENVTQIFHGSDWSNHDISYFAINPSETRLVFDGQRPNDARSKALWLINPASGDYDCSNARERRGIDGKTRCEFIFDERTDVSVEYRNIRFHTVQLER